jgi:environmental stress-induced protein Ves
MTGKPSDFRGSHASTGDKSYTTFTYDQLIAAPWKNGGGVTREIACNPVSANMADFDWRVSIADISASGPFSRFDGIDRVIVLLDGPGVRLRAKDGLDHCLDTPLTPFAFSGESAIGCDLLDGASRDFNVMTRRGVVGATVTVLKQDTVLDAALAGLFFAVDGEWRAMPEGARGEAASLVPDAGLWWATQPLGWTLQPQAGADARLICVQFTRP